MGCQCWYPKGRGCARSPKATPPGALRSFQLLLSNSVHKFRKKLPRRSCTSYPLHCLPSLCSPLPQERRQPSPRSSQTPGTHCSPTPAHRGVQRLPPPCIPSCSLTALPALQAPPDSKHHHHSACPHCHTHLELLPAPAQEARDIKQRDVHVS